MREVFEKYKPTVVFHAAAYKHVALMEANPLESVRNNVVATRVVAEVGVEFGVERFVLVSTDKAVNPKTVMGQSKALCEWIVESFGAPSRRRDPLRRRALRQRPQLVRQRDPDLPQADRARRAGDGDPPRDDALLHDDPGGGLARRPGRRDRRPRPGVRARHGRAGADRRPRAEHDPALGQGRPTRDIADRRSSGSRPGEKIHEELWSERRGGRRDSHPKIMRAEPAAGRRRVARRSSSPSSSSSSDEGDTLEVVARLAPDRARAAAARARRRSIHGSYVIEDTLFGDTKLTLQAPSGGAARVARWTDPRRAEPRAARAAEAVARAGLHPRRRGVRQDDDDHAADRVAGRDAARSRSGRSWRSRSPTRRLASCARGCAARRRRRRGATFHSAALSQLAPLSRRAAGPDPLVEGACSCGGSATRCRAPYKFRPAGDLATEIEWAKNRRLTPDTYYDWARRRTSRRSRADLMAAGLPRVRAAQGGRGAASTSRTCSSGACALLEEDERGAGRAARALPRVHRRRVPGRQPAPAVAARPLARRRRRPLRGRRRLPVDLRLHGRERRSGCSGCRGASRTRPSCGSSGTTARRRRCSSSRTGSSRRLGGAEKTLRPTRAGRPGAGGARLRPAEEEARSCWRACASSRPRACRSRRWRCSVRTNARTADFEEAFHEPGSRSRARRCSPATRRGSC